MTYEELHAEMVAAMKAKDKVRLGVARLVLGELKNAASRGGAHEITEEEVTAQIKRTLKQTNETLEMSEKAATMPRRTENLREQVAVLESLLPQQVSGDELVALVEKTIAELGATSKKDMGRVMGALTAATNGNFDKPAAAKEVGSRLS
ncbi:MAG: GatB/YqeY domain-containing protein [Collinsella sp.]